MKKYILVILCFLTLLFTACDGNVKKASVEKIYDTYHTDFRTYDLLELGFGFSIDDLNPYDTNEIEANAYITLPNNEIIEYPMFYFVDYQRTLRNDVEYLTQTSEGSFRLRYTPTLSGKYKINVVIKAGGQESVSEVMEYNVLSGNKNGFLKVASNNRNLVFSNETPFIGIGHNLCGWEWGGEDNLSGTYEYDKWFLELKSNGANMTQFDLCEGDNIEWSKNETELPYSHEYNGLNNYNQMASWKTDYKVKSASDLGLFFRFSLYHWEDFDKETGNFPDWGWQRNPYNKVNGGPCEDVADFFAKEEAKKATKDYIRYCVARWGYSPNIMIWELWNEVDSPDIVWGDSKSYNSEILNIRKWHDEMGNYLKSLDGNHMLTTSFASSSENDSIWNLSCMDVTTFHRYSMYNSSTDGGVYNGTKVLYIVINQRTKMYSKPVLAGEFAISPGGDIQRDNDLEGIEFHNQLWASIFSGSYGTAMHWTWGSYIDRYDLYYHYKPISKFFSGEDLNGLEVETNIMRNENNIHFKLIDKDRGFAWVKNPKSDYVNIVVNQTPLTELSGQTITFDNLLNKDYVIEIFDTYTGEVIQTLSTSSINGKIEVSLPSFSKDLAVKYYLKDNQYQSVNLGVGRKLDSTYQSGDTLKLMSASVGAGGLSDDCRFAYLSVKGDFTYTVRVEKVNYGGEFATAGIMLRNSLAPSSKMIYLCMNSIGQYNFIYRTGLVSAIDQWKAYYVGAFLKVERSNKTINLYISSDGVNFTLITSFQTSVINDEIYLGVSSSSKNSYGYGEAVFTNIRLEKN